MTADDRRPFLRRLFTRRLEEAAADAPPKRDADLPPGEALAPADAVEADPATASAPVQKSPPAAEPADQSSTAPATPADHAQTGDRTGENRRSGATAAGAEVAPFVPAQRIGADDLPDKSEISVTTSGGGPAVANESTNMPDPADTPSGVNGFPGAEPSGATDTRNVEAGATTAIDARPEVDAPGADDGHIPSFLDADFDEDVDFPSSTGMTSPSASALVEPAPDQPAPPSPVPNEPAPGHPEAAQQLPGQPVPAPRQPGPARPRPGQPVPAPGRPEPGALPGEAGAPVSPAPVGPGREAGDPPDVAELGAGISAESAAQASSPASAAPRRAEAGEWRGIVLVTGTDTDVGKTIVTAAIAAAAQASGLRVAVIKPGQTGMVTGAPTDIEVITRLAAPDTVRTLAEYPEPMAPLAAATIAEMPPLELYEVVDAIRAEADKHDLVLVEGAGGLLVPMGVRPSGEAWTLADLATTLGVGALVVSRAGLGTLNHTALTLEALARRGVPAGVIIGAWPADPQLVHWANLSEFVPHLVGALPDGAGQMDPGVFRRSAPGWLTPALYGVLDNWRVWAEESG